MIKNGYEVCDRCGKDSADNELYGFENNSYQLCDNCCEDGLKIIDKFVKEGENK
jgi:hypothetical protein